MKILLFSDMHLNNWKSWGIDANTGISNRLEDQLSANRQILHAVLKNNIDVSICGGDVYHNRESIPVVAMNFVSQFFDDLKSLTKASYLVRGNHDLVSDSEYKTHWDSLFPIDRRNFSSNIFIIENIRFRLIDYYDQIDVNDIKGFDVVVLHKQPNITNQYGHAYTGIDWKKLSKHNRFVFFGHYHTPTTLSDNCQVLGSIIPLTFADTGKHGIYILDSNTWNLEFVPIDSPKFITVNSVDEVKDDINYYRVLGSKERINKRNVVSIVVPEVFEERIQATNFEDIVTEWCKINEKDNSYIDTLYSTIKKEEVDFDKKMYKGRLKKVTIENFMSIEKIELNIENGFTLVLGQNENGGSNGSGKSSIFDSIYWALFGETTKGLTGDDVVLRGKKNCRIELQLEDKGKIIFVYRTRRDGLSIYLPTEDGDKDITEGLKQAQRQEILEKQILGFDKITYLTSCYFSQENLSTITGLTDADKTNMITHLLGFNIYDSLYEVIKKSMDKIDSIVIESTKKAENIQHSIDLESKTLEGIFGQSSTAKDEISTLKEEIIESTEKIKEIDKKLSIIVEQAIFDTSDYDNKISKLQEEEKIIFELQEKEQEVYRKTQNSYYSIHDELNKSKLALKQFETEIDKLEYQIKNLQNSRFGERCNVCASMITKQNIEIFIEQKRQEIKKLLDNSKKEEQRLSEYIIQYKKEEKNVENSMLKIIEYKNRIIIIKNQIGLLLGEKREKEKEVKKNIEEKANLQSQKQYLEKGVEGKFVRIGSYKEKIIRYSEDIDKIRKKIEEFQIKIIEIDEEKKSLLLQLEILSFWKKSFSSGGIKTLLLDKFCNQFNSIANLYLSSISNGAMSVIIRPTKTLKSGEERNKIGIDILFNESIVKFESLSGGEKKRVDISLCLALNFWISDRYKIENGLLGIIVLDELFAFLDRSGEESIGTLLYNEGMKKAIYVISHTEELNSYAQKQILVKKQNRISNLITN